MMDIKEISSHLPSFNTERLLLRPIESSDVDAMFAIKSDPEVTAAYGAEPHRSVDETRRWVEGLLDARSGEGSVLWVFVPRGKEEAVGSCCYWHIDAESNCAELGYELNRSYWGKGIMTEALAPVLVYGFDGAGFNRIEACPLADNKASNALLVKFGFRKEGNLRERVCFKGRYIDQVYYALLRAEWDARKTA